MIRNKKIILVLVIIVLMLAFLGGVYAYAKAPKMEIFTGLNGKEYSVYTNQDFSLQENESTEKEDLKPGDIIGAGGFQEIVIAVSEDGRVLTMPLEDYEEEQKR